jgi:hypothetical protein
MGNGMNRSEYETWTITYINGRAALGRLAEALLLGQGRLLDSYRWPSEVYRRPTWQVLIALPPGGRAAFEQVAQVTLTPPARLRVPESFGSPEREN